MVHIVVRDQSLDLDYVVLFSSLVEFSKMFTRLESKR